jgi:hypothetical protein
MIRTGAFRYIRFQDLPAFQKKGWMMVADLGFHHGAWSCLCWHCECGEVAP